MASEIEMEIERKNTGCFSFFKSKSKANAKRNEVVLRYEDRRLLNR